MRQISPVGPLVWFKIHQPSIPMPRLKPRTAFSSITKALRNIGMTQLNIRKRLINLSLRIFKFRFPLPRSGSVLHGISYGVKTFSSHRLDQPQGIRTFQNVFLRLENDILTLGNDVLNFGNGCGNLGNAGRRGKTAGQKQIGGKKLPSDHAVHRLGGAFILVRCVLVVGYRLQRLLYETT